MSPATALLSLRCPYCNRHADLVDSKVIYGKSYGNAWVCRGYPLCDSYVGCHKGTDRPLGRMANKELRDAKMAAHKALDPMWRHVISEGKTSNQIRNRVYAWLAKQLEIEYAFCHIGMFDVAMCKRVVEVCAQFKQEPVHAPTSK